MVSFPKSDNRTVLVGSTGSGKTVVGTWLLSTRDYNRRPWFIIDYKHDSLLAQIGAKELKLPIKKLPKAAGLYIIRPQPNVDDENIEKFLWLLWSSEDVGLYIDEGYMIPNPSPAFNAILTQGRSKHIEVITLSQRPVFMTRFVFSEAEYFGVLRLNDIRDRKTVAANTGIDVNFKLPKHYFIWYSSGDDEKVIMRPVPAPAEIVKAFKARLTPSKKPRKV